MEKSQLQAHLADQNSQLDFFSNFFWHRIRSETVVRYLQKYAAETSILDIGAGAGVFGVHIQQMLPQSKYFFCEPLPILHDALVARFGSNASVLEKTHLQQTGFVMLDVLEHIEDDQTYLASLRSRMPKGSVLVLTCPAGDWLWSKWDELMGHHRRYTRKSLTGVCAAAGFEILDSGYMFRALILPALKRRNETAVGPEFPRLPAVLNLAFLWYCRLEKMILGWVPIGTSTFAVVRKQD